MFWNLAGLFWLNSKFSSFRFKKAILHLRGAPRCPRLSQKFSKVPQKLAIVPQRLPKGVPEVLEGVPEAAGGAPEAGDDDA